MLRYYRRYKAPHLRRAIEKINMGKLKVRRALRLPHDLRESGDPARDEAHAGGACSGPWRRTGASGCSTSYSQGFFVCEYSGDVVTTGDYEFVMDEGSIIDPRRTFPKRRSEWGDASAALGDDDRVPCPQFPHFQEPGYVLDVSRRRNLASYISHSWTPNVFVQFVVRGGENESCPHLMVFAMDVIPPMRELNIDYDMDDQQIVPRHGGLKTIAQLESEMQNLARPLGIRKNLDKEKKMLPQKPDATQNLEFEVKQLKGELEVMKHKDYESKMKIDELTEVIQEKDDDTKYMESQHGILVTRDLMSNDELQDARKKLIKGLADVTSGQTSIGIKRMGDLDSKSFANACKHKMSDIEATLLCSELEDGIKNPNWHPFDVGSDDGKGKRENIEENKKLTTTKCHQPRGNILVSTK